MSGPKLLTGRAVKAVLKLPENLPTTAYTELPASDVISEKQPVNRKLLSRAVDAHLSMTATGYSF
jgi:hypothetical protein